MKITQQYITRDSRINPCFKRATTYTIHETGNQYAGAQNERNNLQNNGGSTSFHSVVDEKECIRCIPFNKGAYHAGTTAGNNTSLSLEICTSGLIKAWGRTWDNAVEIVATDLNALGWGVDRLRQHNDWSGKDCPHMIRQRGVWEKFKKDVKNRMEEKKRSKTDFDVAMEWAKKEGITDGSNPKGYLTREQFFAVLYRMKKKGMI